MINPMFLPEEEHKNLECRIASCVVNGELHVPKCSASACGHWRFDTNDQNPTFGMGYCGLAGIPQLY